MATYVSAQNTQQPDLVSNPVLDPTAGRPACQGELFHAFVTYALSSGTEELANDIINLTVLPVGAALVPHLCSVYSADPGTTLTLDVGYTANPDAYADNIVLSAGGLVNFTSATAPSGALALEPMTTGQLYATVATAGTLTDAVVLSFNLVYRFPNQAA